MPEPGTDRAPGRRWRYVPRELVAVIALQLAGAGAGVAAALAVGSAGPARASTQPARCRPRDMTAA